MPPTARGHRLTTAGLLTAAAGAVLFAWVVWRVGPGEIATGFRQIGWGLAWILALGGLRFAARAAAWALCIEPPHRLPFVDAFAAVICGDSLGNLTPLGPIVGEPAKAACVRHQVPLGVSLTALAIENIFYTLSVAAVLGAGTIALLFSVPLPLELREFSEIALAAVVAVFVAAGWVLWKRPALVSGWLPIPARGGSKMPSRLERLRALELQVYTFAARRRAVVLPVIVAQLGFHTLGVAEAYIALWLILGNPPSVMTSFIVEATNRLIIVAFKFVPFQVGFGEAGTAYTTDLLGLGSAPGVTLSIARKARMAFWSVVGMAILMRQGLSARRILEDTELNAGPR